MIAGIPKRLPGAAIGGITEASKERCRSKNPLLSALRRGEGM